MSARMQITLLWLLASVVALVVALAPAHAALVGGHYIPVGNDSFFHAYRILALITDPSSLHEFDTRVHYPEGSALIWPWGYDYAMSLLTRAGLALNLSNDPIAILDHIPVLAFPVCLLLVLRVCRELQLSAIGTLLAMLATALFPLNQGIFAVGNIDHHFAELMFVLAALGCGLSWLRHPDSVARACTAAVVLGVAPCIHNGLFILQLPLVAAFAWTWIRGGQVPRSAWIFAGVLAGATLLAALPSSSFRHGGFVFYTLSWFHVYFAACVGVVCGYMSRASFSRNRLLLLLGMGTAMLVPVLSQLLLADRFLSVSVEGAERIGEVQSVWELGVNGRSLNAVTRCYSLLIYLLPITAAMCVWQLWRSTDSARTLLWVTSLFGLALLALMVRLHVFGSFALYLPWIALLDQPTLASRLAPRTTRLALALALLVAFAPVVSQVFSRKITGNDPYYALTNDIYPALASQCARKPAVALSNLDDANYILFHTQCPVIANNFLLTPFHEKKVREVRALMNLSAAELGRLAPQVGYVFVHRQSLFRLDDRGDMKFMAGGNPDDPDPPLVRELMTAAPGQLPPGFRLVQELSFEKPAHIPYARLFAIDPPVATTPSS